MVVVIAAAILYLVPGLWVILTHTIKRGTRQPQMKPWVRVLLLVAIALMLLCWLLMPND
jgi:hypothetical protein